MNTHYLNYFYNYLINYLNFDKNKKYIINYIINFFLKKCIYINKLYKMDNNLKSIISNIKISESTTIGSLIKLTGYWNKVWNKVWNNGISKNSLKEILKKKIKLLNSCNDSILDNFSTGKQITTIIV